VDYRTQATLFKWYPIPRIDDLWAIKGQGVSHLWICAHTYQQVKLNETDYQETAFRTLDYGAGVLPLNLQYTFSIYVNHK
jgi:hypothetical protein